MPDSQAGAYRTVSPLDFGAVGDCQADDTAALIKMRDSLLAQQAADRTNTIGFTIESPAGKCYKYTNNRWTWGLRRLKLLFHGSSIQNVSNSNWTEDKMVFYSNRYAFYTIAYNARLHSTPTISGSLIETAPIGSRLVTLKDPSDISGFKAGGWALVYSYDQQMGGVGGFPPNPRYYDYVKIISITGQTLMLDRALTGDHRADYPEVPNRDSTYGRARIIQLDRDIPFCESLEIDGVKTLNNPNITPDTAKNYFMVIDTYNLTITNSEIYSLSPSITHSVVVRNTKIDYTEPDKIIDSFLFENCDIRRAAGATGVKDMQVNGGKIEGMLYMAPRNLKIDHVVLNGKTFKGQEDRVGGDYAITYATNLFAMPVRSLEIVNSTLTGKNNPADRLFADQRPIDLKVDGSTVTVSKEGTVKAPLAQKATQDFLNCLEVDKPVVVTAYPPDNVPGFGTPRSIRGDSSDAIIDFTFSRAIEPGYELNCIRVAKIDLQNNTYSDWVTKPETQFLTRSRLPKALAVNYESRIADGGERSTQTFGTMNSSGLDLPIQGIVKRIIIDVTKPYTGPSPSAVATFAMDSNLPTGIRETINLMVAGRREISDTAVAGAQQGDIISALNHQLVKSLGITYGKSPTGREQLAGTLDQQSSYTLTIVGENPFRQALEKYHSHK